jgi:hypothetical protein
LNNEVYYTAPKIKCQTEICRCCDSVGCARTVCVRLRMTGVALCPVAAGLRFPQSASTSADDRIGWAKWFAGASDRACASGAFAGVSAMCNVYRGCVRCRATRRMKGGCRGPQPPSGDAKQGAYNCSVGLVWLAAGSGYRRVMLPVCRLGRCRVR